MSSNEKRLIADHQEVVRTLRLYDNINLIKTSGDPVDTYDIEYRLRGYIIANGKISISKSHRIKIKIPFGYPHFPPTIKPLSPIFHPEIDENVVPIANYWEENPSLINLILHIGNMICGTAYNLQRPFNLKAAKFYEKHQNNLPLDSLSRIEEKETKAPREPLQLDFLKPFFVAAILIVFLGIAGGGGIFFYEKWKTDQAEKQLTQAEAYLQQNDFRRARSTAQQAMARSAGTFFILRSTGTALVEEIDEFLKSKALTEGLLGKIQYGDVYLPAERVQQLEFVKDLIGEAEAQADKGELQKAAEDYENALAYAVKHALEEDREAILHDLSRIKLQLLIASSEKAHAAKNWDWAVEKHTALLDFIEEYRQYLDTVEKQEARTRHLLLIDTIAFYSQRAMDAENNYDFATALEHHNALIDLIGKSSPKIDTTLHQTLIDSIQKAAVLTEKLHIEDQRQWLLENYKEIFQAHYPAILPATLRNPQALFVKYDGENMVFDLSCLEKSSGSIVRLRLFYEYDPNSQQWRVYKGQIEDRS